MKCYSQFTFGDLLLSYDLDKAGCVSMSVLPAGMEGQVLQKEFHPEPLVQLHARGDSFPNGYGNGHTMACSSASEALKFVSQNREGNTVTTTVSDGKGRTVRHRVSWAEPFPASLRIPERIR